MGAARESRQRGANRFGTTGGVISGLARILELALDDVDLSLAEYRLLGFCALEPANPSEIAAWLSVGQQNLSRQIDSLVTRELLDRTVDENDRRRVVLSVTHEGRSLLRAADAGIDRMLSHIAGRLKAADRQALRDGFLAAEQAMNSIWDFAIEQPQHQPGSRNASHRGRAPTNDP